MGISCTLSVPQEQIRMGQLMTSFLTRMALTLDLFFTVLKAQKKELGQ